MKYFILISLVCLLKACDSSVISNSIEEKNQIAVVQDDGIYLDREFVYSLIKLKKNGHLQQLSEGVNILNDQLVTHKIISTDKIERLEFNSSINKIYFQYLAFDLIREKWIHYLKNYDLL